MNILKHFLSLLCVHVHVCIHVCVCECTCVYLCIRVCVYEYTHTHVEARRQPHISFYVAVHVFLLRQSLNGLQPA